MDDIRRGLDFLDGRVSHYLKIVTTDETFLGRTRGVGTMTKDQADLFGAVGPTARASGVKRDIRIDSPYSAYGDFPSKLIIAEAGDLEARFVVRMNELTDSIRLIRTILDNMPVSELETRMPRRIPAGETISRVEAPRGELLYFMKSNGTDKPERVKVRTPSLCNWAPVSEIAIGHKLADVPMILSGIDPCFSCNDRMVTVNRNHESPQTWSWEDLRLYGIQYYASKK
jgi:NADH-quinone oxidoreductase subunit D